MTLVISAIGEKYAVQVADRRISGARLDDEWNKSAMLVAADAHLLVGYSGLAVAGSFHGGRWMCEALADSGAPDFLHDGILRRFTQRATSDFAKLNVAPTLKRTTILFTGFLNSVPKRLPILAMVSNFESPAEGVTTPEAKSEFTLSLAGSAVLCSEVHLASIETIGQNTSVTASEREQLRQLLLDGRPARAVVGKSVSVIRDAAKRTVAGNTIGGQAMALIMDRQASHAVEAKYFTERNVGVGYMPNLISATGNGPSYAMLGAELRPSGSSSGALVVPRVGRNQPCPCKSGKKYKLCHGRFAQQQ